MGDYFMLVAKSDTTIGIPVGSHSEIARELWDLNREAVEKMSRDGLAWYASQADAELTGPVRWSLHMLGNPLIPPIEQGVWGD